MNVQTDDSNESMKRPFTNVKQKNPEITTGRLSSSEDFYTMYMYKL